MCYFNVWIMIEGYCDECGMCEYNFVLGDCCVNLVKNYLVVKGVLLLWMMVISYGVEWLVVMGLDDVSWVVNCCVVMVVLN